jgi:hypothetical protein
LKKTQEKKEKKIPSKRAMSCKSEMSVAARSWQVFEKVIAAAAR